MLLDAGRQTKVIKWVNAELDNKCRECPILCECANDSLYVWKGSVEAEEVLSDTVCERKASIE